MRWLVVLALLASTPAHAGAGFDLAYISGELRGTTAVLVLRHNIIASGPTFDMGLHTIALPHNASATAVTVHAPDGVHRLDLVAMKDARARFNAITDDTGPAKRWAVLVEGHEELLVISIAVPHAATFAIDVELQIPTCFARDARIVMLPPEWKYALSPHLHTQRHGCDDTFAEDQGVFVAFPATGIAKRPAFDRIGADAARLDLGDAHIAKLELAVANQLADIPSDLATVILVDTSRSMSRLQIEAQREVVKAYANAAGATQLQIVAFARTARALLPSWTSARGATARIDRELRALAPRNGSNLDLALAEAAKWLARTSGTKRIVIVTDEVLPARLQAKWDSLGVPADTLVHVVAVDDFSEIKRSHGLGSALAERTGGIEVRAGLPDDNPIDATMLLRPIAIDELSITAPGWKRFSGTLVTNCGDRLSEGASCVWWGEGDAVAGPVAAEGWIWGKRFSRVLRPDATRATELARELSHMGILDDRSLERAQKLARSANAVWSFFAQWGGKGGHDVGGFGASGGCCFRGGRAALAPTVRIGQPGIGKLPSVDIAAQLAGIVARCGLESHTEATIETTQHEIVDVRVIAPPDKRACVEDEIWDTSLDVRPAVFRASTRVVLVD